MEPFNVDNPTAVTSASSATLLERIAYLEKQNVSAHDFIRDLSRRIDQLENLLGTNAVPSPCTSSSHYVAAGQVSPSPSW